jgi:hypothetical protein
VVASTLRFPLDLAISFFYFFPDDDEDSVEDWCMAAVELGGQFCFIVLDREHEEDYGERIG